MAGPVIDYRKLKVASKSDKCNVINLFFLLQPVLSKLSQAYIHSIFIKLSRDYQNIRYIIDYLNRPKISFHPNYFVILLLWCTILNQFRNNYCNTEHKTLFPTTKIYLKVKADAHMTFGSNLHSFFRGSLRLNICLSSV